MSNERKDILLSSIHINLKDRSITFESGDQPVAKLTLAPEGVIFEAAYGLPLPRREGELPSTSPATSPGKEKEQTVTLTGKLKSQPKEGKPDSKGNPTAWARLAVHEEDEKEAHMYLASFHRHTVKVALSLPRDAQITVEGYPHRKEDPSKKRTDTLSVINILGYPGKKEKE